MYVQFTPCVQGKFPEKFGNKQVTADNEKYLITSENKEELHAIALDSKVTSRNTLTTFAKKACQKSNAQAKISLWLSFNK